MGDMGWSKLQADLDAQYFRACKEHRESLGLAEDPEDLSQDCEDLPCAIGCPFANMSTRRV
jgi:hypothetical protein